MSPDPEPLLTGEGPHCWLEGEGPSSPPALLQQPLQQGLWSRLQVPTWPWQGGEGEVTVLFCGAWLQQCCDFPK